MNDTTPEQENYQIPSTLDRQIHMRRQIQEEQQFLNEVCK